ncbi:MAG: tetratricopeptide repeat protein [Armatimonadota bacterium]
MTPRPNQTISHDHGDDGLPPIEVHQRGEYLHFPASPADIAAVLRRVPREWLTGLNSVDLKFEADSHFPDAETQATYIGDPYYDRDGAEWLPGIYCGSCLGEYVALEQSIGLLGFVYDPALPDRTMWECYLRFVALSNLMHELAHHVDFREHLQMDRAFWKARSEGVAEADQERWTAEYVVPYLLEAYPVECRVLLSWVEQHAGLPVTLTQLVPEPSLHGNQIVGHALMCDMARLVARGASHAETRLLYLRCLAERTEAELVLPLVERFISDYPDGVDGLVLMARLWIEMELWEGARSLLATLVKRTPQHQAAWFALMECDAAVGDDRRLQRTRTRYAAVFPDPGYAR